MYKVAILGCENSHADAFLKAFLQDKIKDDIEFVGVYSDEPETAQALHDTFGVPIMQHYDEAVGKIDGLIVTARHGANHYKYAKPYIESGIPMFIDKPITVDEEEAVKFMKELKEHGVRVTGGSCVPLANMVQDLKKAVSEETYGKVLGGQIRAPWDADERYGGFFFYTQHLVQVMSEIYGLYPKTVKMYRNGGSITGIVRYEDFDVTVVCYLDNYKYAATVQFENDTVGGTYTLDGCFVKEFLNFYDILTGKEQKQSYKEFIAPVFILTAMYRSLESGKEEKINEIGEI